MPGLYPNAPDPAHIAFTTHARQLLDDAETEAERLGHEYIGTEHVVLALTRDADAANVLTRFGVDREQVRATLEGIVPSGKEPLPRIAKRPYTSRTRQAVGLAVQCAETAGRTAVGVEHLVVGLLRERMNIGAKVLEEHGLTVEQAESALPHGDNEPDAR